MKNNDELLNAFFEELRSGCNPGNFPVIAEVDDDAIDFAGPASDRGPDRTHNNPITRVDLSTLSEDVVKKLINTFLYIHDRLLSKE